MGIWKTESAFVSFLRGRLRRSLWNTSPVKLKFKQSVRKRIPGKKEGNMIWGGQCAICKGLFAQSELDVDHIEGEMSLRTIEDLPTFITSLICYTPEAPFYDATKLQLLCKDCHKTKTYAERYGVSLREAECTKQANAIIKAKQDKMWLEARGITPGLSSPKRKKQLIEALMNDQ